MDLAIGLPNAVSGATARQMTDWARAAEDAGFSSLGTIDRIVYDNYEPLIALAASAAVTERIRLATTVVLGPLRKNAAHVAKQVLSLDAIAGGGRTTLGIALGQRDDDYEVSGVSLSDRAPWMDAALAQIRRIWNGEGGHEARIGPRPPGDGPMLLVGGTVDASFARAAKYGDGWIMGGGTPDAFTDAAERVAAAWQSEGRNGEPYKAALGYFSLGPDAQKNAEHDLLDYYAWLGEEVAGMIVAGAAKDADTVKGYISAFASAGCDEFFLFPCSSDPEQVALLADAAGL
jgi:alkanesulfonate monooxygenase SsuD/methylene tetrahydromethanopterin reductase-like flavin-dependent oxidoreductase (luciferase family)